MDLSEYDVVVLGGGAAGENAADGAVRGGLSALLIEQDLLGGECSYWACIPSKALLRPGTALSAAQAVSGAAQAAQGRLDVAAVLQRRDQWVNHWSDASQVDWATGAGITVLRGAARVTRPKHVTVTLLDGQEKQVHARHAVVVATGSEAAMPPIDGLPTARPWTSRDATSVTEVPSTLTIVGGGVVAVETATLFASLGSTVHVVARSTLLSSLEPFCGDLITTALRERGVHVHLNTGATHFRRRGPLVDVTTSRGAVLTSDEVLIATGRRPRTRGLGLEAVGLTGGSWLTTDDSMQVRGHDWLYAVGDVTGRALFTHQGKYQGRAAAAAIVARATQGPANFQPWGDESATADEVAVPQVIFADPEIATVGTTARAATERGLTVDVVDYDLGAVSGSGLHADNYTGQARMVIDRQKRVVLGVTFAGPAVGELIHAATVAIVGRVPVDRLWHAVPAYPTISEIWLRLLEAHRRQADDAGPKPGPEPLPCSPRSGRALTQPTSTRDRHHRRRTTKEETHDDHGHNHVPRG